MALPKFEDACLQSSGRRDGKLNHLRTRASCGRESEYSVITVIV